MQSTSMPLEIGQALIPVTDLTPRSDNPRAIMADAFAQLVASIRRDPTYLEERPVLATPDGRIYAGEMRYRAVRHLYECGWDSPWGARAIPARIADIEEATARARMVKDNTAAGAWVDDDLAEILATLKADEPEALPSLGIPDDELRTILALAGLGLPVDPFSGHVDDPDARSTPAPRQRGKTGERRGTVVSCPACGHAFLGGRTSGQPGDVP